MNQKEEKNQKEGKENNTCMTAIGYFFAALFLIMVFYMVYFTALKSDEVVNNPYNKRIAALEDSVVRGSIYSSDGTVLARSVIHENGSIERQYPYGNIFSHIVGISTNGKSGIESNANYYLLRSSQNPLSRLKNMLDGSKDMGDGIITTLDKDIQQAAYDALGNNRGAVVVIEPSTGKILAMVSKPDFDPNMIEQTWDSIISSGDTVLYNRALQGLYPPGSTFKTVTLLEYMRENNNYADYTYDCDGSIYRGGLLLKCINGKAHGMNDLKGAFAVSCNSAFADIGLSLDKSAFADTAEELLYNKELPIKLAYNESSFTLKEDSDEAMIMQTAIGQGETLISPFHNCLIAAAIANDGVLMTPYFIDKIVDYDGVVIRSFSPSKYRKLMTEEEAAALADYMRTVVTEGTAYSLKNAEYDAAGKTGSAQYDNSSFHHSWFIGFAPYDEPEIAVCVLLEGGYGNVSGAHETAKKVFDVYFEK